MDLTINSPLTVEIVYDHFIEKSRLANANSKLAPSSLNSINSPLKKSEALENASLS